MMNRPLALLALPLLIVATGCETKAQSAPAPAVTVTATPLPTSTPTPTPTPTATEDASDCDTDADLDTDPVTLTTEWFIVLGTRGDAGDQKKYVKMFAADTKDFADGNKDFTTHACGDLATAASLLALDAAQLNVELLIYGDEGKSKTYRTTTRDGQKLFDRLGYTDYKFGDNALG